MSTNPILSRRSFIAASGVVVAAVTIPSPSYASDSIPNNLEVTDVGTTTVLVPGNDQSSSLPRDLGFTIDGPLPSGAEFNITYDSRIYMLRETIAAVHGGRDIGVQLSNPADGKITITTLEALPVGQLTVIAGQLSPKRYPHDILRDGGQVQLEARISGQKLGLQGVLPQDTNVIDAGEPWGAECGAQWEEISWQRDGEYRYYRPLSASVLSTGPGPIPAGSSIRVLCDARIVTSMKVKSASNSSSQPVEGSSTEINIPGITGFDWTMKSDVPAGDQISLTLESTIEIPNQDLEGAKCPNIDFISHDTGLDAQRNTYRESIRSKGIIVSAAMRQDITILASMKGKN